MQIEMHWSAFWTHLNELQYHHVSFAGVREPCLLFVLLWNSPFKITDLHTVANSYILLYKPRMTNGETNISLISFWLCFKNLYINHELISDLYQLKYWRLLKVASKQFQTKDLTTPDPRLGKWPDPPANSLPLATWWGICDYNVEIAICKVLWVIIPYFCFAVQKNKATWIQWLSQGGARWPVPKISKNGLTSLHSYTRKFTQNFKSIMRFKANMLSLYKDSFGGSSQH